MKNSDSRQLDKEWVFACLGPPLLAHLRTIHARLHGDLYLTGGTVRDLLLGRRPSDVDLTVNQGATRWAGLLAGLTGGTLVPLGKEEDAARVVFGNQVVDFSSFRLGASTIDEELALRDITINAMALPVASCFGMFPEGTAGVPLLDPRGGRQDLADRLIRAVASRSFTDDPLRLLRAFRFSALLDFTVEPGTLSRIGRERAAIRRVAAERISHELDLLLASGRAAACIGQMAATGLLWEILPELRAGVGMAQPASHHLDVFDHSLAALEWMEMLQRDPGRFFPDSPALREYLRNESAELCWAALLHDVGKPPTVGINEEKDGRITFYNHDQVGVRLVENIANRLRWSGQARATVAALVGLHMRPFHLSNVQRQQGLSLRAAIRCIRAAGKHLEGMFLLAMADSLAGKGKESPREMERDLVGLYEYLKKILRDHVEPVQSAPPLLSGRDLIEQLHLAPGPFFREILEAIAQARMEGAVTTPAEALALAREVLAAHHSNQE